MTEWKIGMRGRFPLGRWRTNGRTRPRMLLWKKERKFSNIFYQGVRERTNRCWPVAFENTSGSSDTGTLVGKTSNPFRFLSVCVCVGEKRGCVSWQTAVPSFRRDLSFYTEWKKMPGSRAFTWNDLLRKTDDAALWNGIPLLKSVDSLSLFGRRRRRVPRNQFIPSAHGLMDPLIITQCFCRVVCSVFHCVRDEGNRQVQSRRRESLFDAAVSLYFSWDCCFHTEGRRDTCVWWLGNDKKFKQRPLLSAREKNKQIRSKKRNFLLFLPPRGCASSRSVPYYEGMDARDKRAVDKSVRKRTKHTTAGHRQSINTTHIR